MSRSAANGGGHFEVPFPGAEERVLRCEISTRSVMIGATAHAIWVIEDITERKRAEEKIRSALVEKEVLLKEIYHRVKNNLQVVSSLLNMQSRRAASLDTKRLLDDSASRVASIALVHEQLYRAENLSSIELREYIGRLARSLTSVNRPLSMRVDLRVEVDEIFMGIESAIPLGLVVNELVSNAYRHAYPAGADEGVILVRMSRLAGGCLRLEIRDDGRGLPVGFDPSRDGGLGLQLVLALTGQLGGELTFDTGRGGACFDLKFRPETLAHERMVV